MEPVALLLNTGGICVEWYEFGGSEHPQKGVPGVPDPRKGGRSTQYDMGFNVQKVTAPTPTGKWGVQEGGKARGPMIEAKEG